MAALRANWVWGAYAALIIAALLVRIAGLGLPYHHDEYKWAVAANTYDGAESPIPHPPLALLIYTQVGDLIGYDHLRVIPALASMAVLVLLLWYMRRRWGDTAALAAGAAYAFAPYALLGSLQIDIDGVFLPLCALASFAGYALWQEGRRAGLWLLTAGLVLGFAFKLSFILVPAALCLDFLLRRPGVRAALCRPAVLAGIGAAALAGGAALALLWEQVAFLRYVGNFTALSGRDYFQVLFQTVKAGIYLSPLLVAGIALAWRRYRDLSVWYIFLALNILFYFVAFDFSHRTLDRYLLFFVLPASVMLGVALRDLLPRTKEWWLWVGAGTAALAAALHALFSLSYRVVPLIPKTEFVRSFLQGEWGFLLPLSGGSGPLGFYVPFGVVAALWAAAALAALALILKKGSILALGVLVSVSAAYCGFVSYEYLMGRYFGSAPLVLERLMPQALERGNPILTYNDIGAYDLYQAKLYAGRFYPHDEYVAANAPRLAAYGGDYLVIDMPALGGDSAYARYFDTCETVAQEVSGQVSGRLLDCSRVDPQLLLGAAKQP